MKLMNNGCGLSTVLLYSGCPKYIIYYENMLKHRIFSP